MIDRIITALDVSSRSEAIGLVQDLHDLSGMFKVGSQLYMAEGPAIVREIIGLGSRVFLDLKFHDIPNTVVHAVREAAKTGVSMVTVHASGGRSMMEAVAGELKTFGTAKPLVVAVTVLTSLDRVRLEEIGVHSPLDEHALRLAHLAERCGMDGVVCSPQEVSALRKAVRPGFKLVTPGIRMPDQSLNDQQRIATPVDAIGAGADYIVVGRAVTAEPNPRAAMEKLLGSLQGTPGALPLRRFT